MIVVNPSPSPGWRHLLSVTSRDLSRYLGVGFHGVFAGALPSAACFSMGKAK